MRSLVFALLAVVSLSAPAAAQNYVERADTLLRRGRVFAAETLYYYAARRDPRDPVARLALGRYLAARGRLKVGAVLMEEARFFGGDARTVASYLAPVYGRLGDWKALATLPGTPLAYSERSRAEWLRDNPPAVQGPDSAWVSYAPADSGAIGVVTLRIGDRELTAIIDPRGQGLLIDTSWARAKGVKVFASTFEGDVRNHAAVTRSVQLGDLTLSNVPTRFGSSGSAGQARIGLDVLAQLAPTFDARRRAVLLRRAGRVDEPNGGERVPTLTYANGTFLVFRDGLWPVVGTGLHPRLRGTRWTLDPHRGEIIIGG